MTYDGRALGSPALTTAPIERHTTQAGRSHKAPPALARKAGLHVKGNSVLFSWQLRIITIIPLFTEQYQYIMCKNLPIFGTKIPSSLH